MTTSLRAIDDGTFERIFRGAIDTVMGQRKADGDAPLESEA